MPTSTEQKPASAGRGSQRPEDALEKPPWSRVRKVQLIRREIREYLPASTIELLLSAADHVIEGGAELVGAPPVRGRRARGAGAQSTAAPVYASLMTTIDLSVAAEAFREPADAATAQRVAELMTDHDVVRHKLAMRAEAAVAELAGLRPSDLEISLDYDVRAAGNKVFLDADVVASPRRARRG